MLAMGDYTGMQSYDMGRIERARDLPPFGAGPLRDAQWVLHHPEGERTERVIRENEVRYVVFHKLYPGMPWQAFEERQDLYRTAYENESVIVFAARGAFGASGIERTRTSRRGHLAKTRDRGSAGAGHPKEG